MTSARDEILARARAQARTTTPPPAWRSRRNFESLAERFTSSLTASKGEVLVSNSLENALVKLDDLLRSMAARRVVANDEAPLNTLDLPGRWSALEWHIVGQSEGDLREFCTSADVGISSADAALAETGTIVVTSGPGKSRLATLLPPVHIALVPTGCLTTDLFTWTADRQGSPPSMTTLISGPSKSADIEQTMAVGVHGPQRFIVLLYQD